MSEAKAPKFDVGAQVRQVVRVIEGEVIGTKLVDGEVAYLVRWADDQGEVHERYFTGSQIESA